MAEPRFTGSGVALITPFAEQGVNERALRALVEFHVREGTDALVVCGSTGEAATMSAAERRRATEVVVAAAAGRVPVITGCGSDTRQVCRLAAQAHAAGAGRDAGRCRPLQQAAPAQPAGAFPRRPRRLTCR
jgi:4-hydroxy-tetrahydrodipicolinate synthase